MWFVIILGAIGLVGVFYWYAFIFNISSLKIQSNYWDYQIILSSQQQEINHTCETQSCELSKIADFNFTLFANKSWYKTIEKKIDLKRWENVVEINFQKDYFPIAIQKWLDENDKEILDSLTDTQKLIEEKREEIKKSQNLYFFTQTENNKYYFYQKNPQTLNIWKNDQDLWNIDFIEKQNIKVYDIIGNQNEFIIKNNKNYFLFQILQNTFQEINFTLDIQYIKNIDTNTYIFVTSKWPFVWKKNDNSFEYNHLFSDYIEYKNTYIWYISQQNNSLKNKLFSNIDNNKNIFYQYNPKNKEKNILFQSDYQIEKIYYSDKKVIIQDINKQIYEIPHL